MAGNFADASRLAERAAARNGSASSAQRSLEAETSPIAASLEEQARTLTSRLSDAQESPVISSLRREFGLTLEHVQNAKHLFSEQMRSLVRVECYVDTELMQMEQRTPRYSPYRYPEREKLHRRLHQVGGERRKLVAAHEERVQRLHDRLLDQLNKHAQLSPPNGDK